MEPRLVFPVHNRELASQEARVRAALGLSAGPLPAVGRRWLEKYYDHLAGRLSFPFEARYAEQSNSFSVTVSALLAPNHHALDEYAGLVCQTTLGAQDREIPLVDLEIDEDHPNFQLLEDYWYWVWNWRFDPQI